jgi:pimeloyl-ACP methyl ester carboxylesterase
VGPDGKILAIGHSAGAMNAHFAGMRLPEEIRAQIIVRAFAPAKIIEKDFPFAGTQNFMSSNRDILMKYLKQVNGVEFENAIKSGLLQVLPAHPDASTFNDHRLKSPTFKKPITGLLENFTDKYDCR